MLKRHGVFQKVWGLGWLGFNGLAIHGGWIAAANVTLVKPLRVLNLDT